MKGNYEKGKYKCPHCSEGREQVALETPEHLLSDYSAYSDFRTGLNVEVVLEDRCAFLRQAIKRRKGLDEKLRH